MGKTLLLCWIQQKIICQETSRNCSVVIAYRRKTYSVVSHTGKNLFRCIPHWKKSLPVYPTTEENLFRYIPHRKKTWNLNNCAKFNFSAKSILLMNHGPRWSSLPKKLEGEKSRDTIPLSGLRSRHEPEVHVPYSQSGVVPMSSSSGVG